MAQLVLRMSMTLAGDVRKGVNPYTCSIFTIDPDTGMLEKFWEASDGVQIPPDRGMHSVSSERCSSRVKMQPLLLCLSEDPLLLATRSLVLATRYTVVQVSNLGELEALPESSAFQVLVICHSVPRTHCEMAIRISQSRWPGIKILSITKSEYDQPACEDGIAISAFKGPRALLDCLFQLSQC